MDASSYNPFTFFNRESKLNQRFFILFQFQSKMINLKIVLVYRYIKLKITFQGGRVIASLSPWAWLAN